MGKVFPKFNKSKRVYAARAGQQYSVNSIDYTAADQSPAQLRVAEFYVETTTDKTAMTKGRNIEWYVVIGNISYLAEGYLLHNTKVTSPFTTIPDITIYNFNEFNDYIGFKTSRIGALYNGEEKVFDNIRFEILPSSAFPGSPLDREIESSLNVPSVQAVMYKRQLDTDLRDGEGMFLYTTDENPSIIWKIRTVTNLGNLQVLDLERAIRGT